MFLKTNKLMIASDHGGFKLKSHLISFLEKKGLDVVDGGCYSEESVDYPEFGIKAAKAVASGEVEAGIIICGTGIGISIAANRIKGARASLCHSVEYAELTRLHNDSNILALGGRFNTEKSAEEIVQKWISTEYEGGRHQNRVDLIDTLS
jgi:ribose 5-phosphate isomerase B